MPRYWCIANRGLCIERFKKRLEWVRANGPAQFKSCENAIRGCEMLMIEGLSRVERGTDVLEVQVTHSEE